MCSSTYVTLLCSRESLKEKLAASFSEADVVITSGGVSMGEMVSLLNRVIDQC